MQEKKNEFKMILVVLALVVLGFGGYTFFKERLAQNTQPEVKMEMSGENFEGVETEAKDEVNYVDIGPVEAKKLMESNPDLIVIDVSPNYDQGHLPGAVNYYLGDGSLEEAMPSLDKNATYLVYCHVDSVSIQGAQMLIDAGFRNVYRLEGNYSAWVDAGYEIEK